MRGQVEAKGLKAFTTYNYQFAVCNSNNTSPVGRTKTAPSAHANLDELKLAVFSCSNYREYFPRNKPKSTALADSQFSQRLFQRIRQRRAEGPA
jgi:phosphodiesterase/alkaline phosphatase D-like protein